MTERLFLSLLLGEFSVERRDGALDGGVCLSVLEWTHSVTERLDGPVWTDVHESYQPVVETYGVEASGFGMAGGKGGGPAGDGLIVFHSLMCVYTGYHGCEKSCRMSIPTNGRKRWQEERYLYH